MLSLPFPFHPFASRFFGIAVLVLGSLSCTQVTSSSDPQGPIREVNRDGLQQRMDRIDDAVKNGDMTREEADELHAGIRRRLAKSESKGERPARTFTREEYEAAATRMQGMVEADEVSQEDVDTRLGRMRRMMKRSDGQQKAKVDPDRQEMAGVRKRIGIAIESGKMTPEQGRARWDGYMASRNQKSQTVAQENYDSAVAKLFHMVEEGEVTADQALRRLRGMNARMKKAKEGSDRQDSDEG